MRVIFFGSGGFSRDLLENIIQKGLQIEAIVTRPDRPAGRGRHLRPTPVKAFAKNGNWVVLQPQSPSHKGFAESLEKLHPDLLLVADYGYILPHTILQLPPLGCINIHPSLLPRYRGVSPIQRALMDGGEVTGVTMMLMDEGLDTGPIISQEEIKIEEDDDSATLREKLAELASRMILNDMTLFVSGRITPRAQDESQATYADAIVASEKVIDWSRDSNAIHNQVRALSPRPGAYTFFRGRRVKILRSWPEGALEYLGVGEVKVTEKNTLTAGTGGGALTIIVLQPEGKKVLEAAEFVRGYRPIPGEGFTDKPA